MNEDIFSILNGNNSGKALLILYKQNIELTTYEKVLLANHWVQSGSPNELEHRMIAMLGEDWETYFNPFLHKLMTYRVESLVLKQPTEFNSLAESKYDELMKSVLHKKLKEFEANNTKHGYETKRDLLVNTNSRKLLTYSISSKTKRFDLIRVELEAVGYKYDIRIFMMETGVNLGEGLTEKCVTNLKGLMYFMSEEDEWDVKQIDRSLNFIQFNSQILNSLIKAMRELYDAKDETIDGK